MEFQPVKYEDLDEIRNLQPADWSDIIPDFRFYIESSFCYPVKIKIDGKIVGVGASIVLENTAWLAHIIVDASYRRQGIGSGLVEELFTCHGGEPVATYSLIATRSGKPVYEKAGFKDVTEYTFLQRGAWQPRVISSNIVPFREEFRSRIYAMDIKISGESRSILMDKLLADSLIYVRNDEITGFYIPGLKEGFICADTEEAGIELLKVKYAGIDKANLPSDNVAAIAFLKQNGFEDTGKKGTRMIRGKELHWKPQKIYSRIGGNLG